MWVQRFAKHLEVSESNCQESERGMLPGRSRVRRMSLDLLEDLDCGTEVPYIDPTLEEIQSVVERVRLLEFADKVHRRLSYNAGIEIYVGAFAKCHWNPTAH